MPCICDCICCLYLLFLPPPSLQIDPETADDPPEYNYVIDDQPLSAELLGKQPPLTHAYITYSFSLLLALEIAAALFYPILMHNLFL